MTGASFENDWRDMLAKGFFANSAPQPMDVGAVDLAGLGPGPSPVPAGTLEIVFRPDYTIWDGRFQQQRLDAGVPQADQQADLGQRRLYQSDNRAAAGLGK